MTRSDETSSPLPEPDPQARVMRILAGVAVGGILLALVIGVAVPGATGEGGALVVGGLACVLGVCLAFYAVGRSEDLDREREREQRPPEP